MAQLHVEGKTPLEFSPCMSGAWSVSVLRRVIALVLDQLLLNIINYIALAVLVTLWDGWTNISATLMVPANLRTALTLILSIDCAWLLLTVVLVYRQGRTVGMYLMNQRMVSIATGKVNGGANIRFLLLNALISVLTFGLGPLIMWFATQDEGNRHWFDHATGLITICTKRGCDTATTSPAVEEDVLSPSKPMPWLPESLTERPDIIQTPLTHKLAMEAAEEAAESAPASEPDSAASNTDKNQTVDSEPAKETTPKPMAQEKPKGEVKQDTEEVKPQDASGEKSVVKEPAAKEPAAKESADKTPAAKQDSAPEQKETPVEAQGAAGETKSEEPAETDAPAADKQPEQDAKPEFIAEVPFAVESPTQEPASQPKPVAKETEPTATPQHNEPTPAEQQAAQAEASKTSDNAAQPAANPSPEELERTIARRPLDVVRLTFDDGSRHFLTGTVIVGRAPEPDASHPGAQLLAIQDPGRSISKVHMALTMRNGVVLVEDLHSLNGTTVVFTHGGVQAVAPGTTVPAPIGSTVHFGYRSVVIGG